MLYGATEKKKKKPKQEIEKKKKVKAEKKEKPTKKKTKKVVVIDADDEKVKQVQEWVDSHEGALVELAGPVHGMLKSIRANVRRKRDTSIKRAALISSMHPVIDEYMNEPPQAPRQAKKKRKREEAFESIQYDDKAVDVIQHDDNAADVVISYRGLAEFADCYHAELAKEIETVRMMYLQTQFAHEEAKLALMS
jgi:hypothetical protein